MQNKKGNILKRKGILIVSFIFVGMVLFSCDKQRYFEQDQPINKGIWYYKDTKSFSFEIKDSLQAFNFFINVRNTVDYPYANLYFFIQSELPDGTLAKDTVECQLADYQGKWLGEGSGELRDNRFILRRNMRFKQKGSYQFLINHGMRTDSLKGITDIGIRLETVK